MNIYLHVLTDGVLSSLLIPFHSQTTFFAMKSFGGFDMRIAAMMAVVGATAGQMVNWGAGRLLLHLWRAGYVRFKGQSYDKIARFFTRFGIAALLLSWLPLFSFFTFAAGVFNCRWFYVMFLIMTGQALYYGSFVI